LGEIRCSRSLMSSGSRCNEHSTGPF
jgi:hypothetical protein